MKKCPFCAEEIQDEAVKCRFCKEFLDDSREARPVQKVPWYFKTSSWVVGFLLIGPFIIPLIWLNPRYSNTKKIVITGICLVITFLLFKGMKFSFSTLDQYDQMLQGNF